MANFKFDYLDPSNQQTNKDRYFLKNETGLIFSDTTDELFLTALNIPTSESSIVVNVAYKIKNISMFYYNFCEGLFLTYWIMFAIWASMNILYDKKDKLWIVLVAFTNIIGYGFYKFYHCKLKNLTNK